MITAQSELESFIDRKGALFADALLEVAKTDSLRRAYPRTIEDVASLIKKTETLANLYGRKRLLIEASTVAKDKRAIFAEIPENANPLGSLVYTEAVEDVLTREPKIVEAASPIDFDRWRREAAQQVSELYRDEHAFAMARSASEKVTARVQKEIGKWLEEGKPWNEIEETVHNIGTSAEAGAVRDWTKAYSAVVYRNAASRAYTEGRFQQAEDPEIAEVIPALEMVGIADHAERPNHRAARGFIAPPNHPGWHKARPPLGHQCRHGANMVSRFTLERMGLFKDGKVIPHYPPEWQNAGPDPGFNNMTTEF
jgi:hypothetical protein